MKVRKEKLKAKEKSEYNDLKREAFLKTLKYLKYLKMSFEVTKQDYFQDKEGRKQIDDAYSKIDDAYALIRLYSSEKVFNLFNTIYSCYRNFSFPDESGWRLSETGKFDFLVKFISKNHERRSWVSKYRLWG